MSDRRAFLVRLALDEAFRDRFDRDPDAAFAEYTLDEADRAVLRRRDEGWLALLGAVVRDEAPPAPSLPLAAPEALPEARVLLVLRPHPVPADGGGTRPGWAVSIAPWPSPVDPQAAGFVVRVVPRSTPAGDGALRVTYTARIEPAGAVPADGEAALAPGAPPAALASGTAAARAAAEAVLAAASTERYARLRDLLAVVTGEAP